MNQEANEMSIGVVGEGPWAKMMICLIERAGHRAVVWSPQDNEGPQAMAQACRLIFLTGSMRSARPLLMTLGDVLAGYHRVVHTFRDLEPSTGTRCSELIRELTPVRQVGAFVGPVHPSAVLEGKPSGAIVGSQFSSIVTQVQSALSNPLLRIYGSDDIIGVEIAASASLALATAVGFLDELDLGASVRGMLFARGIAEMARLGKVLGAQSATFSGMSGLGYLIATTSPPGGGSYMLGRMLARGSSLEDVRRGEGGAMLDELAVGCETICKQARAQGAQLYLTEAVMGVLTGDVSVHEAMGGLFALRPMTES